MCLASYQYMYTPGGVRVWDEEGPGGYDGSRLMTISHYQPATTLAPSLTTTTTTPSLPKTGAHHPLCWSVSEKPGGGDGWWDEDGGDGTMICCTCGESQSAVLLPSFSAKASRPIAVGCRPIGWVGCSFGAQLSLVVEELVPQLLVLPAHHHQHGHHHQRSVVGPWSRQQPVKEAK